MSGRRVRSARPRAGPWRRAGRRPPARWGGRCRLGGPGLQVDDPFLELGHAHRYGGRRGARAGRRVAHLRLVSGCIVRVELGQQLGDPAHAREHGDVQVLVAQPAIGERGLDLLARDAPRVARCGVVHWTSSSRRGTPSPVSSRTSSTRATLDASVRRWNIDSPANRPPMPTPYSPPASSPSARSHTSTLCATPRAASRAYASRMSLPIQPPGRRRSAHPATTASKSRSSVTK